MIFWDTATGRAAGRQGRPTSRSRKSHGQGATVRARREVGGHPRRRLGPVLGRRHGRGDPPLRAPQQRALSTACHWTAPGSRIRPTARSWRRRASATAASSCSTSPPAASSARLDGPGNQFKALAFSPDGTILATGIDTGKRTERRELAIRLWDVAARKELGRVPAHRSYIRALAFSPDGRRLVSASEDGTALVWDVAAIIGGRRRPPNLEARRCMGIDLAIPVVRTAGSAIAQGHSSMTDQKSMGRS